MKRIILIFILLLIGLGSSYYYSYTKNSEGHKLNLHHIVKTEEFKNWMNFNPKDENFSASFPQKPEISNRNLSIPGGQDFLPYKEFVCETEKNTSFSISYTILPNEWLTYGNGLVLGRALKVIMKELGKTELVGKKITRFKSFPALDYEHYTINDGSQKETAGTLVLVKNVLYKIEATYPLEFHKRMQNQLANFIENFVPKNFEFTSFQHENSEADTLQFP